VSLSDVLIVIDFDCFSIHCQRRKANGIPKIEIGGEKAGLGDRYFSNPIVDAAEVVDEFFKQAKEIAQVGNNVVKRKEALNVYKNRRKNEKADGTVDGLNNW
jgi:hypothetical protein